MSNKVYSGCAHEGRGGARGTNIGIQIIPLKNRKNEQLKNTNNQGQSEFVHMKRGEALEAQTEIIDTIEKRKKMNS